MNYLDYSQTESNDQQTSAATASTITLREYQQRMVGQTYQHIKQGTNRILHAIIMGAGKTVIAAWIMRDAASRGHRCVFLVSLNVLLEQTAATLRELGVSATILQGNRPIDPNASVIVASCQTIQARARRGHSFESLIGRPRLILVDEAHNTAFLNIYAAIEEYYLGKGTAFIGLTATPWRLSKKQWLGQRFETLVEGPQPPDIIKAGGAVPCRGYTITGVLDLETLHTRNGDYIDGEIASQATRAEALEHVVSEWQRLCPDRPTLMVGATVKQAEATMAQFNASGIPAELIVGSTPQAERLAIFDRVTRGETKIICSVGCLTAGFNLPCISAVLYVRATKSKALFHQTAGRGSRPYPGKADYLLLDFGRNLKKHGNPMGYQEYYIGPPPPIDEPTPQIKTCEDCGAEVNIFARICPECGAEFGGDRVVEERDVVLAELNEYVDRFTKEKIKNLRAWRKAAFEHGQSPDEPIERFVANYGYTPPAEWLRHAALGRRNPSQKRKVLFLNWLTERSRGGQWAEQWIAYHLRLEFGNGDIESLGIYRCWDEVLGVPYTADWQAIKAAYRERIRDLPDGHPDHELLALAIDDARADFTEAQAVEVAS